MLKRIITAAVGIAVLIAVLSAPPIVFSIALFLVTLMMLYECCSATGADKGMMTVGFVSAVLLFSPAAAYVFRYALIQYSPSAEGAAVMLIIAMHMILVVVKHGKKDYKTILANGFLTIYIVFGMNCLWLAKERYGTAVMLLIFISAWATDTFAYFSGRAFGKHKLIPKVSPNKTVEGSIGGIIGAMAACTAYLAIVNNALNIETFSNNIFIPGIIIGLAGGILSQLGDLAASAIKRDTGIKDFGRIFPGHGGFMDRFDSVVFIAPIIYRIIVLISASVVG